MIKRTGRIFMLYQPQIGYLRLVQQNFNTDNHFLPKGMNKNKRETFPPGSSHCCCCSVAKTCLTHGDPMDCSTPGSPLLLRLPEFAHIHVH